MKLIHNITDYKRQAKFDFGLYHFFPYSRVISLDLPKNTNFVDFHSMIQFPFLKQIIWNLYGRSETVKGNPSLIKDFTTFSFLRNIPFWPKKTTIPQYTGQTIPFMVPRLSPLLLLLEKRALVSHEHIFFKSSSPNKINYRCKT